MSCSKNEQLLFGKDKATVQQCTMLLHSRLRKLGGPTLPPMDKNLLLCLFSAAYLLSSKSGWSLDVHSLPLCGTSGGTSAGECVFPQCSNIFSDSFVYTAEKVIVGVRELWPSWRGAGACRASPGQAGKDRAIGPIPPAQPESRTALLGLGMAKAGQDIIPWGTPGQEAQLWEVWRQHPMAGVGPDGPRLGWGGARGEDTKVHGCPQGPDGMGDFFLQKIKGFKIIIVLTVVFRTNISRWSISRKEMWGWKPWLPKGQSSALCWLQDSKKHLQASCSRGGGHRLETIACWPSSTRIWKSSLENR